jgi:hypothetical protein
VFRARPVPFLSSLPYAPSGSGIKKEGIAGIAPTTPKKARKKAKQPLSFRGSFALTISLLGFYSATGFVPEKGKASPAIPSNLSLCFLLQPSAISKPFINSPHPAGTIGGEYSPQT